MTVETTLSRERASTFRSNAPGPGSYNFQSAFPSGPKFVIQRKTKFDSLFKTKISQNIGPGPAAYKQPRPLGGTHQSIAIKFKKDKSEERFNVSEAGPGAYDINHVKYLKKSPSACFGRTKRNTKSLSVCSAGPQDHNKHYEMTDKKVTSVERNAARCTIGNEVKNKKLDMATPGPNQYDTMSQRNIGDGASVKVPFAQQIRPISAKPGEIKKIINPGPQDYFAVHVDFYKRRSTVISCKFNNAGKELEGAGKTEGRAKSPGPNQYRPQSAVVLSKSPNATIGNTLRQF